ncbi:coiled-coil domain-containing protein [Allorhodopirellula solitaria]|uniref:Chromosome partition protein Smc n=1 Tax=Allorhodopirellula solitaria TaxID=2527987 RepID=A0A5C5X2J5_9BACT|nr:hypothetical protein [Allorhodopirellula solitaria]TWT56452.1 Chromosome partition protein Smc [Allorhodopirellula solitaria]
MTAYPDPPSQSSYPGENYPPANYPASSSPASGQTPTPADQNLSDNVRPELPSNLWPWLIGTGAVIALSLQTWSLLGLLEAGGQESDFQAKVSAWESANKNRQEAIDTWNSIEQQAGQNVDQLREQSALLQGTIDSLQKQRDQLVETTTSQAKTLQSLQDAREGLQNKVDLAKTKLADVTEQQQSVLLAVKTAEATQTQTESLNDQLIERGKRIKTALAALEAESAKAEAEVETQEKLISKSEAELAAMEARVSQFDTFLQKKLASVAEFKLQQEKSSQTAKELETTAEELRRQTAAVAKATNALAVLKKQVDDQNATRDQSDQDLANVQANVKAAETQLADLRKREQQLAQQMATMTTTLSAAATDASESLSKISETAAATIQEMAAKATEVRKAVSQIQVPVIESSVAEPPSTDPSVTEPAAETSGEQP